MCFPLMVRPPFCGGGSPVPWDVHHFLENPAPTADARQVGKGAGQWGSGEDGLIKSLVI